jgi:hypothetical protein
MSMPWAVMAQTAIGAVLVVAAVAKFGGKASITSFLEAMSVHRSLAAPVGIALPVAEGTLGVLLVLRIGGGAVVLAAAALCASFAVTLVVAQLRGVTAGCRCFGALDGDRLTPVSVARAVVLAVAAGALAAWGGGASTVAGADATTAMGLGVLAAGVYVAGFGVAAQIYEFERGRRRVIAHLRARPSVATAEEFGG